MIRWISSFLIAQMMMVAAEEPVVRGVEDMIPAPVKALAEPGLHDFQGGLKMAVTAIDEETQAHVVEGLNHLHGGWEFEASRHFAAAARRDPKCLLAHWGMAIALLSPGPETSSQREVAMERMLALVDDGAGNDLERGYAYGLIQYYKEGPAAAAEAYRKVSERFPNDLQAAMFAALFGRGAYDAIGQPTPEQQASEKLLEGLLVKYPDSTLLIHALLTIRAEAPDLTASLPLARKLCQLAPDYPPYFQVLGHYEWRTGNHLLAAAAFSKASTLFDAWMTGAKATVLDCPGWVASESYRAVALASKGDFDTAFALANSLAAKKVPLNRAGSSGGRMLLWEAKTLPARLLMSRGAKGDAVKALAALPSVADISAYKEKSLAHWYVDGLRLDLDGLRLIEEGKYQDAFHVAEALTRHGESLTRVQESSSVGGERSYWNRSFRALEVLASELRGRLSLAGPKSNHGSAYNWFRSAIDRQARASMFLPPAVLTPMGVRLGDYQLAMNKPADAVEAYEEALVAFPNDLVALKGLANAADKAGKTEEAAATRKKIEEVTAP